MRSTAFAQLIQSADQVLAILFLPINANLTVNLVNQGVPILMIVTVTLELTVLQHFAPHLINVRLIVLLVWPVDHIQMDATVTLPFNAYPDPVFQMHVHHYITALHCHSEVGMNPVTAMMIHNAHLNIAIQIITVPLHAKQILPVDHMQ